MIEEITASIPVYRCTKCKRMWVAEGLSKEEIRAHKCEPEVSIKTAFGCYANYISEYDGMTIQEFCDYCHDNGENIYVVEFGRITTLANTRDHTLQMHNLWVGRFTKKEE